MIVELFLGPEDGKLIDWSYPQEILLLPTDLEGDEPARVQVYRYVGVRPSGRRVWKWDHEEARP